MARLTSQNPDFVRLVVVDPRRPSAATVLDVWDSYEFDNNLLTPSDSFSFTVKLSSRKGRPQATTEFRDLLESVRPDTVVRLEVGPDHDLAATGIIDDQFIKGTVDDEMIQIAGRDGISLLQDNICDSSLKLSGATVPAIATKILEKYRGKGLRLDVRTDNDSNRDIWTGKRKPLRPRFGEVKVKQVRTAVGVYEINAPLQVKDTIPLDFVRLPSEEARPHPGETEYAFLDRHARNVGVMMWMSADGDLIFSRPDYSQDVLFRLTRKRKGGAGLNNIISGGARRNTANSATSVRAYGHTTGRGDFKEQVRSSASLPSGSYVWPRVKVFRDGNAKSGERAKREAQRALSRANTNILTCEYTMRDHGQNGILYCPDTLAEIDDDVADVHGVFYVVGRKINKSLSGTFTTLQLVPKGAIVLD